MQLILEGSSNRELVRTFGTMTLAKAMNAPQPAIGALARTHGRERVEKTLAVMLVETAAYFDAEMGKEQALDIAAEITTTYPFLKMEDAWVVLSELRSAELFGKLTSNKVLSALRKYTDKRLEAAGQQSLNEHLARQETRAEATGSARLAEIKHAWELKHFKEKHEKPESK
jgi:hypothetical protein